MEARVNFFYVQAALHLCAGAGQNTRNLFCCSDVWSCKLSIIARCERLMIQMAIRNVWVTDLI